MHSPIRLVPWGSTCRVLCRGPRAGEGPLSRRGLPLLALHLLICAVHISSRRSPLFEAPACLSSGTRVLAGPELRVPNLCFLNVASELFRSPAIFQGAWWFQSTGSKSSVLHMVYTLKSRFTIIFTKSSHVLNNGYLPQSSGRATRAFPGLSCPMADGGS